MKAYAVNCTVNDPFGNLVHASNMNVFGQRKDAQQLMAAIAQECETKQPALYRNVETVMLGGRVERVNCTRTEDGYKECFTCVLMNVCLSID